MYIASYFRFKPETEQWKLTYEVCDEDSLDKFIEKLKDRLEKRQITEVHIWQSNYYLNLKQSWGDAKFRKKDKKKPEVPKPKKYEKREVVVRHKKRFDIKKT